MREEVNLEKFCDLAKQMEIGSGKTSNKKKEHNLKWKASSGDINAGALCFYTSETLSADRKMSEEERRQKEFQTKSLIVNDLIACGAFTAEELKRANTVIDLVVKVYEGVFRLRKSPEEIEEGRAAYVSGSIKFHRMPNIEAMMKTLH